MIMKGSATTPTRIRGARVNQESRKGYSTAGPAYRFDLPLAFSNHLRHQLMRPLYRIA
jgi:hypothetical protein